MPDADAAKAWIQRKLGHGVICVELTDEQLDDAIDEALRWFAQYIGQVKVSTLQVSSTVIEYDVIDDCEHVVEVAFESGSDEISNAFDWAEVDLSLLAYPYGYGYGYANYYVNDIFSNILQIRQYHEMATRIVSADSDWEWDPMARKLRVFISSRIGSIAWYAYLTNAVEITKLDQAEYKLVRQYAYAEAMDTLAHIRSKYAELPSVTGSISLNADTLFANSESLKANLDEQVKMRNMPIPFFSR